LVVTVEASEESEVAVVRCEGQVDFSTCLALRSALKSVVKAKPEVIRLDLTGTRFLDSILRAWPACCMPTTTAVALASPSMPCLQ
jgi:hypothetical protein